MNTISIPVPGVNTQAYSSVNTGIKPANVTAHIPPTGIIRNGKTLLKTLENIWFVYKIEGYFVAGNDYIARKLKTAESTIGRALSRLEEMQAIRITQYPGLLREITPLISIAELRTLMRDLLRSFLARESRTASPIIVSSASDVSKITPTTEPEHETETFPVPASVGCSLASQKEKDNDTTPFPEIMHDESPEPASIPAEVHQHDAATTETAPRIEGNGSRRRGDAVLGTPHVLPLDLPAAAAQLVEEGKVKAKIVLSHIRRAGREIVDIACCAIIEHSQKKAIESYEKALWSAVHDEWEPSEGFILPYRRGVVSADYVKPAPDAPASCWPGAKPDPIHRREYSRNHETGKDEPVSGKCRGLITRMVNWTYRSSRGISDNEWLDVARSVVRSGSYLHLPMDWEAPRVEGGEP